MHINKSHSEIMYVLHQQTKVRVEFLIAANEPLITATGVGVGLLFLIIITVVLYKVSVDINFQIIITLRTILWHKTEMKDTPLLSSSCLLL